jgi:hypothetical protein
VLSVAFCLLFSVGILAVFIVHFYFIRGNILYEIISILLGSLPFGIALDLILHPSRNTKGLIENTWLHLLIITVVNLFSSIGLIVQNRILLGPFTMTSSGIRVWMIPASGILLCVLQTAICLAQVILRQLGPTRSIKTRFRGDSDVLNPADGDGVSRPLLTAEFEQLPPSEEEEHETPNAFSSVEIRLLKSISKD